MRAPTGRGGLGLVVLALLASTLAVVGVTSPATAVTSVALDPSYGDGGTARSSYSGRVGGTVVAARRVPEGAPGAGDIVVAVDAPHTNWGCCQAEVGHWALVRLTPEGTPRADFGTGGVIHPARAATGDSIAAMSPVDMVVDSAGRILLVGYDRVVRLTSAGVVDTTFGTNGVARLPKTATGCHSAETLSWTGPAVVGPKVVVTSGCFSGGDSYRAIALRLTGAGQLDTSFGNGGTRNVAIPFDGACCGGEVNVLPGGALLVAIETDVLPTSGPSLDAIVMLRLTPDGAVDTSFNGDGWASVVQDGVHALRLLPDGALLAVNDVSRRLIRIETDGTVDSSYKPELPGPRCGYDGVADALVADDGGVLAWTTCYKAPGYLSAVTAAGVGDSAFGTRPTGVLPADSTLFGGRFEAFVADGTGFFLIGSDATYGLRIERRTRSGVLDGGYGAGGSRHVDIVGRYFSMRGVDSALDASGRVVTATLVEDRGLEDPGVILLTRRLESGAPDPSFGVGGTARIEVDEQQPLNGPLELGDDLHLVVRPDGSARVVADLEQDYPDPSVILVAGVTSAGQPDAAVGAGGRLRVPMPEDAYTVTDAADGGAGRLLVALEDHGIVRLTAAGQLDPTYGGAGVVVPSNRAEGVRLLAQAGGAVVATWTEWTNDFDNDDLVVARFGGAGETDVSFARSRRRMAANASWKVAQTASGKVLLGWEQPVGSDSAADIRVLRLTTAGAPDGSFGASGTAILRSDAADEPYADDILEAMGSAGESVVLLLHVRRDDRGSYHLRRLTATGAVDSAFGKPAYPAPEEGRTFFVGTTRQLHSDADGRVYVVSPTYGAGSPRPADDLLVRRYVARVLGPEDLGPIGGPPESRPVLRGSATVRWSGLTGPVRLETSTAGGSGAFGPWATGTSNADGAGSATIKVPRGGTRCVRAVDAEGSRTGHRCLSAPVRAVDLSATGSWRTLSGTAYYAKQARRAGARGASLVWRNVRASSLSIVATTCPGCRSARVLWAGAVVRTLDLTTSTTRRRRVFKVTLPGLATGPVKIVARGAGVTIEGIAAHGARP